MLRSLSSERALRMDMNIPLAKREVNTYTVLLWSLLLSALTVYPWHRGSVHKDEILTEKGMHVNTSFSDTTSSIKLLFSP